MKLNLPFYITSFLYFTLMHIGLWGKIDWGKDTKFRLLLAVDRKTSQRQQTETQSCLFAGTCEGDVLWDVLQGGISWGSLPTKPWTGNGRLCPVIGKNFQLRDVKSWSPSKWWSLTRDSLSLKIFVFCLHYLWIQSSITVLHCLCYISIYYSITQ